MNSTRISIALIGMAATLCMHVTPALAQDSAAATKPAAPQKAPAAERALAITQSDPKLQWGACPPIFPSGCQITVLHGEPAQPNADVFLRVPGGYAIPMHWHTSPERMILVSGELEVQYAGQSPATLKVGDYAFGPAKAPHEARCLGKDTCTLFIAFETPVDAHALTKKSRNGIVRTVFGIETSG